MIVSLFLILMLNAWPSAPIKDITCFQNVTETLMKLKMSQKWKTLNRAGDNIILYSANGNGQLYSVWLSNTSTASTIVVEKENVLIQHVFHKNDSCKIITEVVEKNDRIYSAKDFFTDSQANSLFVIVLWSSHMSISQQHIRDSKNTKFTVPVIYLLDSDADEKSANEFVSKEKLPDNFLRRWNFSGLTAIEHYPTTLLIKNGELVKTVPGYSNSKILEKLIKDYL